MINNSIQNKISLLFNSGSNISEISKKLNISRSTARKYLIKNSSYENDGNPNPYDSVAPSYGNDKPYASVASIQSPPNYNYASVAPPNPSYDPTPVLQSQHSQEMTMFMMNMMQKQNENLSLQMQNMRQQKLLSERENRELLLKKLEKTHSREPNNDYRMRLEEKLQQMEDNLREREQKFLLDQAKNKDEQMSPGKIQGIIENSVSQNINEVTRERADEIFNEVIAKYQGQIDQQQNIESGKIAMFREKNRLQLDLAELDQNQRKGNVWSSVLESVVGAIGNGIESNPTITTDETITPTIQTSNG